jgi:hypothetical protein
VGIHGKIHGKMVGKSYFLGKIHGKMVGKLVLLVSHPLKRGQFLFSICSYFFGGKNLILKGSIGGKIHGKMVGKLVEIGGFSWSCHYFLDGKN